MFSGCTVSPDSKETKLGSNAQGSSPWAGKNTEVVLVPCCTWKCVLKGISGDVDISDAPAGHFLRQMSSHWGSQKILQGLMFHEVTTYLSAFYLLLTQWIMAILSKGCKPDNFEWHNSLKLSFTPKGFCYSYAWSCSLREGRTSFYKGFCQTRKHSPSLCIAFDVISSNIGSLNQHIC